MTQIFFVDPYSVKKELEQQKTSQGERFPDTDFFLVGIFPHLD